MLFKNIFFVFSLGLSTSVFAYDLDMHYYVSAYIWSHFNSGLQLNDAQLIAARSNQFTDDNMDVTGPSMSLSEKGSKQRRNWHFPGEFEYGFFLNTYGTTSRNSVFAKHVVNKALESNNPYQLGMAMHTYLDSFAHEGYAGRFGHASAGHDPDRPHLDPDKFREATFMMGQIIRQWFINNGMPLNSAQIDLNLIHETAKFVPTAWWCSGYVEWLAKPSCYGNTYEGNEIPERVNYWVSKLNLDNRFIPDYAKLEGSDKQNFDFASLSHIVPEKAQDALSMEWLYKDWSGMPYTLINVPQKTNTTKDFSEANAKSKAFNQAALANDVIKNPDSYLSGYPYQLASAKGVNQLLKAASKNDKGWETMIMLAGTPHSNWNWIPYWKYVRKYLKNSKNIHAFLFAMAVAANVEATEQETCILIDDFLKSYDFNSHDPEDNLIFIETIPTKSDYISVCAKHSLIALSNLSANMEFAPLIAAKLALIADDEQVNPVRSSKGKSEMVRWNAINTLINMNDVAIVQKTNAPTAKSTNISSAIGQWLVHAEQDFDDDLHNSWVDKKSLNDLEDKLRKAIIIGDKAAISTICSSIATYDKSDLDDQTLIELLKSALSDPYFNDDADELSFALLSLSN